MIAPDLLQQVASKIETAGISEAVITLLRGSFPEVHFSYCLDDDVQNIEPALQHSHFNLYLIDGHNHCLSLTSDPAVATGLLVAERLED